MATSPLIPILHLGIAQHQIVSNGVVYTGFTDFGDLHGSACVFVPMNSNRAINDEVVQERVDSNLAEFERKGRYCEFGQINLLVIDTDPTMRFYILDGQHRVETMRRLYALHGPSRLIPFQFRAKRMLNEDEAVEELLHFQNAYPSDPRTFFPRIAQTILATEVLERFKRQINSPDLFRPITKASRCGMRVGDPDRPFLNDNIFFWILQSSGLVAAGRDAAWVLSRLFAMDAILRAPRRPAAADERDDDASDWRGELERRSGVTAGMRRRAADLGCFLGLLREGKLEWRQLRARLPPDEGPQPAPAPALQVDPPQLNGHGDGAAAAGDGCAGPLASGGRVKREVRPAAAAAAAALRRGGPEAGGGESDGDDVVVRGVSRADGSDGAAVLVSDDGSDASPARPSRRRRRAEAGGEGVEEEGSVGRSRQRRRRS